VRRADGQLIVLVACEDVTERWRTEDALRLSETSMAHAQRLAQVGSFSYKRGGGDGVILWDIPEHWSAELWRIAGFDPADGFPATEILFSLIHPHDRQRMVDANMQVVENGSPLDITYRQYRPNGELRTLHSLATLIIDNGVATRFVGATIDITEQVKGTEELRRSREYLAEAQKVSHTGSFGWRVASGEITWSEETFRIFECDRAMTPTLELLQQRTHPDDRVRLQRFLERVSQDGEDWELEHRLLMPDGSVKYLRAVAHAVRDASDELEFVGAVMDITAARMADEALQQTRAELARVTRVTTLGELTAAIAHEVNQPLTGLVSSGNACLRWLAGEAPNLDAARRAVERMVRDGTRAGEVISRIRALVRKSSPRRDWLNVNDAINEVVALIRTEIQRNSISLQTQLSNDSPLILGDRIQLQQVILNLVMNAVEAMSGIDKAQRSLVVASVKDGLDAVVVEVRDSGVGLDSTAPDRVFDAFFTTKPDGMGMGLAISRTIVEAHGGELSAMSNAPRGAIFRFRLPTDGEARSPS
jgi:signal transduction histidine kinase